jgi:hypothetical protein
MTDDEIDKKIIKSRNNHISRIIKLLDSYFMKYGDLEDGDDELRNKIWYYTSPNKKDLQNDNSTQRSPGELLWRMVRDLRSRSYSRRHMGI